MARSVGHGSRGLQTCDFFFCVDGSKNLHTPQTRDRIITSITPQAENMSFEQFFDLTAAFIFILFIYWVVLRQSQIIRQKKGATAV